MPMPMRKRGVRGLVKGGLLGSSFGSISPGRSKDYYIMAIMSGPWMGERRRKEVILMIQKALGLQLTTLDYLVA